MQLKEEFQKLFNSKDSNNNIFDLELLEFSKLILNNKIQIPHLFRFSNVDYYNIRGLETESLFLSPVGSMNDIFEGLSCEITDTIIDKIDKISDSAYLKSFSEDKDNLLMWAHYAQNYSGMCVEYNFSKLDDNILCHLFPVNYSNKRNININLNRVICDLKKLKQDNDEGTLQYDYIFLNDIMATFLNKATSWSYEKEWRIIVTYPHLFNTAEELSNENEDENIFYNIDSQKISVKDCIEAIYLGPRIKKEFKEHIIEICKKTLTKTKLYSSRLSDKEYKLDFKQL